MANKNIAELTCVGVRDIGSRVRFTGQWNPIFKNPLPCQLDARMNVAIVFTNLVLAVKVIQNTQFWYLLFVNITVWAWALCEVLEAGSQNSNDV